MTSIFENTHSKVTIHILHDETLTEDNRQKFIRTAEKYSQRVKFYDIREYKKYLGKDIEKLSGKYTIGCCYRLAIPDVIDSIGKIIYLDCDTIVNLDIRELWNVDLDGKSLAGVLDVGFYRKSWLSHYGISCMINGCRASSYINSGVLIMNLKEIRKSGYFFSTSIRWLKIHSCSSSLPDQDMYNALFYGSIKILAWKFNYRPDYHSEVLSKVIIHNAGTNKPWLTLSNSKNCIMYWDMYLRSAWGENMTPIELVRTLASIPDVSQYYHKSAWQCLKRAGKAILRRLTFPAFLRSIVMILRHMYYLLTHR